MKIDNLKNRLKTDQIFFGEKHKDVICDLC